MQIFETKRKWWNYTPYVSCIKMPTRRYGWNRRTIYSRSDFFKEAAYRNSWRSRVKQSWRGRKIRPDSLSNKEVTRHLISILFQTDHKCHAILSRNSDKRCFAFENWIESAWNSCVFTSTPGESENSSCILDKKNIPLGGCMLPVELQMREKVKFFPVFSNTN